MKPTPDQTWLLVTSAFHNPGCGLRRRENVVYLSGRVVDEQADPFVYRNVKYSKAGSRATVKREVIDAPFRNRAIVGSGAVAIISVLGSLSFCVFGYYLNVSYGMAWRAFDAQTNIQDVDKRFYNVRAFRFKKDSFTSQSALKLLVIGNSFGRDFVNMTTETFDTKNIEIIYRNDLSDCVVPYKNPLSATLFGSADLIVFAFRLPKRLRSDGRSILERATVRTCSTLALRILVPI
jgi:hypothetical protein